MSLNKFYAASLVKRVQTGDCAEAALEEASHACSLPGTLNVTWRDTTKTMTVDEARQKVIDAANAFAELYTLTEGPTAMLAKHYLRDGALAREAVVGVYTQARRGIGQLRDLSLFEPWIRGFTFWKCYSLQRARLARLSEADSSAALSRLASHSSENEPAASADSSASDPVSEAFRTEDLHRVLEMLPVSEKEILLLHYSAGMTLDKAAAELRISRSKADLLLEEGRKNLCRILEDPADKMNSFEKGEEP